MNRLLRNALAGINWPYELAWDISALGGANSRIILATAMRAVEDRQDLLRPFAKRAVGYAVAKAVKMGTLPPNPDWWKWNFTMPARMSADFGRDSEAVRQDYLHGLANLSGICDERGENIDDFIAQRKMDNEKLTLAGLPIPSSWGELTTEEERAKQAGQQLGRGGQPVLNSQTANDDEEDDKEEEAKRQADMMAKLSALAHQPINVNVTVPPPTTASAPARKSVSIVRDAEGRATGITEETS